MDTMADYLTCGQCLKEFPLQKITLFIQHKKLDCDDEGENSITDPELQCNYCPQGFMTAWGLLIHAQISHNLKIFLERASRTILKENKIYLDNPQEDRTVLKFPKADRTPPMKAILGYSPETESNLVVDTNISSSPEHIKSQPKKDGEKLSHRKEYSVELARNTDDPPKFGSSITVTRDLRTDLKEVMGLPQPSANAIKQSVTNLHYEKEITEKITANSSASGTIAKTVEQLTQSEHEVMLYNSSCKDTVTQIVKESTDSQESKQKGEPSEKGIGTNKSDGSSIVNDMERCGTDDVEMDECCDNQGCGVTVIPGTHQDLQKCCNAVVPKKRKRHMEMKHMSFSWSSKRYGRRRLLNRSLSSRSMASGNLTKSSSIFIEVEPDTALLNKQSNNNNNTDERGTETSVGFNITSENVNSMTRVPNSEISVQALAGAESKPKSLILKPGAIFSIPFTYTIPVTSTQPSLRFNTPVTMPTVSQKAPVLAASLNQNTHTARETTQTDNAVQLPQVTTPDKDSNKSSAKVTDAQQKRHSPSKPFHCEICSMSFNQRIHLKKHIMSKHTGNKPYKCGECDYSTVERSHLKVHIRIHTGEKPFKCTYCEYATAQNSTLKIHLKRHHGGKMFHCSTCEKEFTQEQQLRGHECEQIGVTGPDRKNAPLSSSTTVPRLAADPLVASDRIENSVSIESNTGQVTSLPGFSLTQVMKTEDVDTNNQVQPSAT